MILACKYAFTVQPPSELRRNFARVLPSLRQVAQKHTKYQKKIKIYCAPLEQTSAPLEQTTAPLEQTII